MRLKPSDITACLVTRGDVPLEPIIEHMPDFADVLVYDNSKEHVDLKVFGRYDVAKRAKTDIVAWVDDDVVFERWDELLAAYEPNTFVSNNAHGPNTGGYDDLALQAAGALCPVWLIADTWAKWWQRYPQERFYEVVRNLQEDGVAMPVSGIAGHIYGVLFEADFIFGVLCKSWKQIDLPYDRLYADDNSRLCRQPWQSYWKLHMTNLARGIRDSLVSDDRPA